MGTSEINEARAVIEAERVEELAVMKTVGASPARRFASAHRILREMRQTPRTLIS